VPSIRVKKPVTVTLTYTEKRTFDVGDHHDVPDVYAYHWFAQQEGVEIIDAPEPEAELEMETSEGISETPKRPRGRPRK